MRLSILLTFKTARNSDVLKYAVPFFKCYPFHHLAKFQNIEPQKQYPSLLWSLCRIYTPWFLAYNSLPCRPLYPLCGSRPYHRTPGHKTYIIAVDFLRTKKCRGYVIKVALNNVNVCLHYCSLYQIKDKCFLRALAIAFMCPRTRSTMRRSSIWKKISSSFSFSSSRHRFFTIHYQLDLPIIRFYERDTY